MHKKCPKFKMCKSVFFTLSPAWCSLDLISAMANSSSQHHPPSSLLKYDCILLGFSSFDSELVVKFCQLCLTISLTPLLYSYLICLGSNLIITIFYLASTTTARLYFLKHRFNDITPPIRQN